MKVKCQAGAKESPKSLIFTLSPPGLENCFLNTIGKYEFKKNQTL